MSDNYNEIIISLNRLFNDKELTIARLQKELKGMNKMAASLNKTVLKQQDRIMSDQQLIELDNDIRDGVSMIVECKHYESLTEMLAKAKTMLLNWNPADDYFPVLKKQFGDLMKEIDRLLGPEPKEPPKDDELGLEVGLEEYKKDIIKKYWGNMGAEEIKEVAEKIYNEKDGGSIHHLYILVGNLANLILKQEANNHG